MRLFHEAVSLATLLRNLSENQGVFSCDFPSEPSLLIQNSGVLHWAVMKRNKTQVWQSHRAVYVCLLITVFPELIPVKCIILAKLLNFTIPDLAFTWGAVSWCQYRQNSMGSQLVPCQTWPLIPVSGANLRHSLSNSLVLYSAWWPWRERDASPTLRVRTHNKLKHRIHTW